MLHNPYSNDYHRVHNLQNPYYGDIPNGLQPGKQVFIAGSMTGDDFVINFRTHYGIAFHFNPRTHQHKVARNDELRGGWGAEEDDGPMPFHHHQPFEIIFKVEHDKYLIAVNGQHCFEFHHRCPLHEVSHIEVQGNIHLKELVFSGGHGPQHGSFQSQGVPFYHPLNGVHPGKMIQISGNTPHHGRFVVNLQGEGHPDAHNIALHFSARFDDPYDGKAVVVGSRQGGNWGEEQRSHATEFPFHHTNHFDMLILVEHDVFKIAINGRHFATQHHHHQFHAAHFLAIEGDCSIQSVREY